MPDTPPPPLTWSVHLARREPRRAGGALLIVLLGALAAGFGFQSAVAGILALVLLAGSVSDYLLPVRYRLDERGVEARGPLFVRRLAWSQVRRVERDRLGVRLSPLHQRSRLDAYRGIYLWFPDDGAAAMAAIRRHLEGVRID